MLEDLQSIGLSKNESLVYSSLVKLGSSPATEVIRSTKLHRNTTYETLYKLVEKGLVYSTSIDERKVFDVAHPSELIKMIEDKKSQIAQMEESVKKILVTIDDIRKVSQQEEAKTTVISGAKGLQSVINDMSESTTEVLELARGSGIREALGDTFCEQINRAININKVKFRVIQPENCRNCSDLIDSKYVSSKFVNEKVKKPSSTFIWEDKVFIVFWEQELGTLMQDPNAAKRHKEYFEHCWKQSKR